mmetsp:Transcript_10460/g.23750  ORF Transcript_10460/g.23750 Transcript_10460/m.23750 type:complete len:645 (+) Transcript_10460:132-2066(+)|eukprot:CAMPEP_0178410360 /NCGR_PEP_ID=MMETSP0689_2-20121128/20938_1 /TAXON_ID=160604 /ORGANISM="Amphidinium massartii, Strain CS-259" /LENGTH=644 /DNA_ID=CAMNT_0020031531 /DNA_START=81 /DNA_END=2015 /DNA_ORIENTATION=+
MQGMSRLAQQGDAMVAPLPVTAQDGSELPVYHAVDSEPVLTSSGARRQRQPPRLCTTSGPCFNFVVGFVIVLNIIFLVMQADLGVLGLEDAHYAPLRTDMTLLGVPEGTQEEVIQEGIAKGVEMDEEAKAKLNEGLKSKLDFTGDLQKDAALQGGRRSLSGTAYTVIDFLFVLFYTFEMVFRILDLGCVGYFADPLSLLDIVVVLTGWLDILLPVLLHPRHEPFRPLSPNELFTLSVLRLARVLRIFRLFRVSRTLRVLGRAFAYAVAVVLWVMMLVFLVNLALAIVLTTYVGQRSILWEDKQEAILTLFGSVGRSLTTLFSIMTLQGWREIADLLSLVLPATLTVPCFVLYILIFPFTLIALSSGALSDLFMTAQRKDERWRVQKLQARRAMLTAELTHLLVECSQPQRRSGHLNLEEFTSLLDARYDTIAEHLELIDVYTTKEDLLELFVRLSQDTPTRLDVEIHSLAEAITNMSGFAEAPAVFSIKHALLSMRYDQAARATESTQDAQVQKDASRLHQQQIIQVRQDLAAVNDKLERANKAQELQRKQAEQEREALRVKVDSVVQALNAQGAAMAKLDAVATQLSSQGNAGDKMAEVNAQLAEMSSKSDRLMKLVTFLTSKEAQDFVSAPSTTEPSAAGSG